MTTELSREELIATLRWMASLIERDDSADGTLTYSWSPTPGVYEVEGVIRYGNSEGQGFVRMLSAPNRQVKVERVCGARNPRTGWVCDQPPHDDPKHWTTRDGERYDWFVDA